MGLTMTEKIIERHLAGGGMEAGGEIALAIDQTLTQDSTGTMAYLQLEAMQIGQVRTKRSVAYIDHNMLQEGFENADDHKYIQTVASKHGVYFSRPGNGICHQVHLERFGVPGATLLGSDSHTPTAGGIGMLAIGAGGLDVAVAMGGGAYRISMPEVMNIKLTGALKPHVSAKDIILAVLARLTVKGGVGKVLEYTGEGVRTLSVPQRATIANMGAELGATTSIFPSDDNTRAFLEGQGRGEAYIPLSPDADCVYGSALEIDLGSLEPLCAAPHSPDHVMPVAEAAGRKVDQVAIGSCTNGSFADLMTVAAILKGKTIAPGVSLVISPGSRQALTMLAKNGALADMIAAGARILESGCGPCIGMGQAPATNAVSLRTFNRNFKGRCGTDSAGVYLVSPETAAVSALTGCITAPEPGDITSAAQTIRGIQFEVSDHMIIPPSNDPDSVEVVRGPNIKPFPLGNPPEATIKKKVLIKIGDHITTDHIMPSNAKLLPYRSNIPYLSAFCLVPCDAAFPQRAKDENGGFIIGGQNYGQGSSREHAALVPLFLGVKAVIAKSFARIHKANLINSGIIPLVFKNPDDYDRVNLLDELVINDVVNQLKGMGIVIVKSKTGDIETVLDISPNELDILLCGGKINRIRTTLEAKHE